MSDYSESQVACPFFKEFRKQCIVCEGLCDNSTLHICFGNHKEFKQYQKEHCYNYFEFCEIARLLADKYK